MLTHKTNIIAQELLDINASKKCIYSGASLPLELYKYKSDSVAVLKDAILEKTRQKENFEFIAANVPSAVAVLDAGKRYVLYSKRYFSTQKDKIQRLLILAHAIGHHVNNHELNGPLPAEWEEVEADEFAGYALFMLGVPEQLIEKAVVQIPLTSGVDTSMRIPAVWRGFHRAEGNALNTNHAGFAEKEIDEILPGFPHLALPVEKYSTSADLDEYFLGCKTYNDIDVKLRKALKASGFLGSKYFSVSGGGFAVATQIEQFNGSDASSKSEDTRWQTKLVREDGFSILNYLKSFLSTGPGYFRFFVFVVSNQSLSTKKEYTLTKETAADWLSSGRQGLPSGFSNQPLAPNTSVTALVYEFKVPESTRKPVLTMPSRFRGITHLQKCKIIESLSK